MEVAFALREFELLELLVRNAGRVMTQHKLLQQVWGPAHVDDVPYLRVIIGQLRQTGASAGIIALPWCFTVIAPAQAGARMAHGVI